MLSRSWLAHEVVETTAAVDPPSDIAEFQPGQPGASELLLRVPVARLTRLAVDVAGNRASAATAETDFDILVNAVSFATMSFAAAADIATTVVGDQRLQGRLCGSAARPCASPISRKLLIHSRIALYSRCPFG